MDLLVNLLFSRSVDCDLSHFDWFPSFEVLTLIGVPARARMDEVLCGAERALILVSMRALHKILHLGRSFSRRRWSQLFYICPSSFLGSTPDGDS